MSDKATRVLLDSAEMSRTLDDLAGQLARNHNGNNSLVLIGIRTGGAYLARRLQNLLENKFSRQVPCGVIDINLYRDDWTRIGNRPRVGRTEIPFSIDDKDVLLVDDVLYTGRTIRAAMDAIIDLGRPRRVELLVLVDRGHRELPIRADFVGLITETARDDLVNVYVQEHDGRDEVTLISAA